jgi:hypothetical protein
MAWQIVRRFPLDVASGQQSLRQIPSFDSTMAAIDRQNPYYSKMWRPILREKEKYIG